MRAAVAVRHSKENLLRDSRGQPMVAMVMMVMMGKIKTNTS